MSEEVVMAKGSSENGKVQVGLESLARFWPTARATDGTKGGPNQSGSKGDLMLPSAAVQWPTASARDWKSGDASQDTMERNARPLNEIATAWPLRSRSEESQASTKSTPVKNDAEKRGDFNADRSKCLAGQAKQWPTLWASANENRNTQATPSHGETHGRTLSGDAISFPQVPTISAPGLTSLSRILALLPRLVRRKLNPEFVDWLMGFPIGWSDYRAAETPAYRSWQVMHIAFLHELIKRLSQPASLQEAA